MLKKILFLLLTIGLLFAGFALLRVQKNPYPVEIPGHICQIKDFGALSEADFKNTTAINAAIEACATKGGGRIIIPRGQWLTGGLKLKSNTELHLERGAALIFSSDPRDYLPLELTRFEGLELMNYSPFIYAKDAQNVAITGPGKLIGNGAAWQKWNDSQDLAVLKLYNQSLEKVPPAQRIFGTPEDALRPAFVQFFNCKNIQLQDFSIIDGPMWTIHLVFSENIFAKNLKIATSGHNSDGFVLDSSKNALLENLKIASGDDAIALKSGLESDIWNKEVPSENIMIRNCQIDEGHAAVALGSEMSGSIRNVQIENLQATNTDWGFRIKTLTGRGGTIENIRLKGLRSKNVKEIIAIDLEYPAPTLRPLTTEQPRVKNIRLENILAQKSRKLTYLNGHPENPLENVTIKDVRGDFKYSFTASDVKNLTMEDLKLTVEKKNHADFSNLKDFKAKNILICPKKFGTCAPIDVE